MEDLLIATGLNESQAITYIYLLTSGESTPPAIAKALNLTRTNAYKVLDSLHEIGLARKIEVNKKFVYRAEDPISLTGLVAQERNRVIALEQSVREAMHELRAAYERGTSDRDVQTFRGIHAIKGLYVNQVKQAEPIYSITSRSAVPATNYAAMDAARLLSAKQGTEYHGMVAAPPDTHVADTTDNYLSLIRINNADYTVPVEWTVSGDELIIIEHSDEAPAIRIKNALIAQAFRELWVLVNRGSQQKARP